MIRQQMTLTADSAAKPVPFHRCNEHGRWCLYQGHPHMSLGKISSPGKWVCLRYNAGTGKPESEVSIDIYESVIPLSHHITLEPAEYP